MGDSKQLRFSKNANSGCPGADVARLRGALFSRGTQKISSAGENLIVQTPFAIESCIRVAPTRGARIGFIEI